MGLLDNLFNAVESGALEKRLASVADTIESASKRVEKTLDTAADKPGQALDAAEQKKDAIEQKATDITQAIRPAESTE